MCQKRLHNEEITSVLNYGLLQQASDNNSSQLKVVSYMRVRNQQLPGQLFSFVSLLFCMLGSKSFTKALNIRIIKLKGRADLTDTASTSLFFSNGGTSKRMPNFSTNIRATEGSPSFEKVDIIDLVGGELVKETISCSLVNNAEYVTKRMDEATISSGRDVSDVRLVCVSKTKPAENIQTLYNAGFRVFGENYFQELLLKVEVLPKDIEWHFIGHLQSAKAMKLVKSVPNLSVVETVDNLKLAQKLDSACKAIERGPLSIYIQVDTSGEDTKSGVDPVDLVALVKVIRDECPLLVIAGLMTIGAPEDFTCFDRLAASRVEVAAALGVDPSSLALSMGMSGDYEAAIERGATNIRVGSTIFGARLYQKSNPNGI